jgi:hypothetical protein
MSPPRPRPCARCPAPQFQSTRPEGATGPGSDASFCLGELELLR